MVSEAFKNKMRTNGRETRKVAVYLMKKYTGATNRQIGEYMGELSYSGVAKMVERFKGKMKTDRELREKVERIEKKMSNVKGWPLETPEESGSGAAESTYKEVKENGNEEEDRQLSQATGRQAVRKYLVYKNCYGFGNKYYAIDMEGGNDM
jgi:hypothetical protein